MGEPAREFRASNQKPEANEVEIPLTETGLSQAGAASQDGQLVLNFPDGAIPPSGPSAPVSGPVGPGDTAVVARITPLDPAKLAAVPPGMRPDGNAYRLTLTLKPSSRVVTALAKPGNVVLTVPDPTTTLLFSPDGKAWTRVPADLAGGAGALGASLTRAGYYLAAEPATAAGGGHPSDVRRVLIAAGITVALALTLFFGPRVLRRGRR